MGQRVYSEPIGPMSHYLWLTLYKYSIMRAWVRHFKRQRIYEIITEFYRFIDRIITIIKESQCTVYHKYIITYRPDDIISNVWDQWNALFRQRRLVSMTLKTSWWALLCKHKHKYFPWLSVQNPSYRMTSYIRQTVTW